MATIDILHDAHGNVLGFAEHSDDNHKAGPEARVGQTVTSLDIPGTLAQDPAAFTANVHARLREHLQGAK